MEAKRPNILYSLLVNVAYALAAVVAWPYYLFLLATRKKYRSHMRERWGFVPKFGHRQRDQGTAEVEEADGARRVRATPNEAEAFIDWAAQ